jgi:hypothetical protein
LKTRVLALAALSTLAALVPAAAASRPSTTEPAEEIDVYVTLRDTGITLDRHKATRGAVARFIVHNLGRKPHNFALGKQNVTAVRTGLSTRVLKPRSKVQILLIFLDFRGQISYRSTVAADRANPRMRGVFTIE